MSSIEQCILNIQNYKDLEEKIKIIIRKLNSAAGDTSKLEFRINSYYQVNGDGATVAIRAKDLKTKLNETEDYLKNTILPSISTSITEEANEKERLEQEAEEDS